MKLKEFLLKTNLMFREIQILSRAPPQKEFTRYRDLPGKTISYEAEFSERGAIKPSAPIPGINDIPEEYFDQSVNW